MQFTEKDLDNLSALARIYIKEEEKEKMLHDMQAILGYISEINDGMDQRPETKDQRQDEGETFNVVREDEVTRESGKEKGTILVEAPETENDFVKVSQVMK